MDKKRLFYVAFTAALLTLFGAACESVVTEDPNRYITEGLPAQEVDDKTRAQAGGGIDAMEKVAEDGGLILYMNLSTSEFCIEDKAAQNRYFSNPPGWRDDPLASDDMKNRLGSQLVVEYLGPDTKPGSMNSYKDSFLIGQMQTEKIQNGVLVTYQIGAASHMRNYPEAIRGGEFEKLLEKIPDDERGVIKASYRLLDISSASKAAIDEMARTYTEIRKFDKVYTRRPNLGKAQLSRIERVFKSVGYTYDDITSEHAALGYENTSPLPPSFIIQVEYRLDGGAFTAEIRSEDIRYVKGYRLTRIELLPFFGAAGGEAQGSILVPDGSGALIKVNKDVSKGYAYSQPVYGNDPVRLQADEDRWSNQVYLPVFGMLTDKAPFAAAIGNGAGGGTIDAAVAGVVTSYNQVYASFSPVVYDYLSYDTATDVGSGTVMPILGETERFAVRYMPLDSPRDDYVEAARVYREYLEKAGVINGKSDFDAVPLNVEFIGAADRRKTVLGIPYDVVVPLTTYKEAESLVERFLARGVGEMNVRYTAWANGGVNNTVYSKISPVPAMGGASGLSGFAGYLREKGVAFYPDLELTYVSSNRLLDGFSLTRHAARRVNLQVANLRGRYYSTGAADKSPSVRYIISASQKDAYLDNCLEYLQKKGVSSVSLGSLGATLAADYNQRGPVPRASAQKMLAGTLDSRVKGRYKVMTDGCNQYMLPYAKAVVNMPTGTSSLSVEDQPVPFYQIVLHGSDISMAGEALNAAGDYRKNLLKSAESGMSLYCRLMNADNYALAGAGWYDLYSVSADAWFDRIAEVYRRYNAEIAPVVNARIVAHEALDKNVYQTTFDNGRRVIVNYGDEPYKDVKAMDYAVIKDGGEQ